MVGEAASQCLHLPAGAAETWAQAKARLEAAAKHKPGRGTVLWGIAFVTGITLLDVFLKRVRG